LRRKTPAQGCRADDDGVDTLVLGKHITNLMWILKYEQGHVCYHEHYLLTLRSPISFTTS
jgi:hypothetical protein